VAIGGCLAGLLLVAAVAFVSCRARSAYPKRFAAVVPGRLYRSGAVTPEQLKRLTRELHLRTVVSLLNPAAEVTRAERRAAERLGLRWINIPLPGNGASTAAQRERIKAALFDPDNAPLLVHCAAGTNRTGLAVALYRLHRQGWTLEQVLEEMKRFGFEDEPHHQDLRDALAAEAERARRRPTSAP